MNGASLDRIKPAKFTRFVAEQHLRRWDELELVPGRFILDEKWSEDLLAAIKLSPKRKAAGVDEIFLEALQTNTHLAT